MMDTCHIILQIYKTMTCLIGQDFDSDVDISDGEDDSSAGDVSPRESHVYIDYTPQQLKEMEHMQPHKYKRGILHIESSRRMFVRLSDPTDELRELSISTRLRCGRGFDGDEVLVEVKPVFIHPLGILL